MNQKIEHRGGKRPGAGSKKGSKYKVRKRTPRKYSQISITVELKKQLEIKKNTLGIKKWDDFISHILAGL